MSFPEKPGLKFFYEIIGCHWSWSDPKYGCFRSLTCRRRCGWWRCARRTTATGAWARAAGRAADTCRGSAGELWLVDSGHVTTVLTAHWCRTHNAAFTILHFLADSNFSRAGGMVRSCIGAICNQPKFGIFDKFYLYPKFLGICLKVAHQVWRNWLDFQHLIVPFWCWDISTQCTMLN